MTLRGGLDQLVEAILARLNDAELLPNCRIIAIEREGAHFVLRLSDGGQMHADDVVMATPSHDAASLVQSIAPALADKLRSIRYVSTATVSLGFKRAELGHPLEGFGFVVPRSEKRNILACSWSSTKFTNRAPGDGALIRAFIGGAHAESLAEQEDAALAEMARGELRVMMGITATPVLTRVYRWPKGNPNTRLATRRV